MPCHAGLGRAACQLASSFDVLMDRGFEMPIIPIIPPTRQAGLSLRLDRARSDDAFVHWSWQ